MWRPSRLRAAEEGAQEAGEALEPQQEAAMDAVAQGRVVKEWRLTGETYANYVFRKAKELEDARAEERQRQGCAMLTRWLPCMRCLSCCSACCHLRCRAERTAAPAAAALRAPQDSAKPALVRAEEPEELAAHGAGAAAACASSSSRGRGGGARAA